MKDWVVALIFIALLFLVIIFATKPSYGHEAITGWPYPNSCCNEQDCRHLEPEEVEIRETGYFIKTYGIFIEFGEANTSPDGWFHICIYGIIDHLWDLKYPPQDCGQSGACIRNAPMHTSKYLDVTTKCFFAPGTM